MSTETEWATIAHTDDGTIAGHIPVHVAEGLGVEVRGRISNDQLRLLKAHPAWRPALRPLPK